MIKAAKKAISAVLGKQDCSDEQLHSVFCGVESLLNSRPLTYQSSDPKDNVPLTPNHFLYGQMGGSNALEVEEEGFQPQQRWRKVQQLISQVWSRWLKEFIPLLNRRPKWLSVVDSLKIGDVVMLLETGLPRGQWPLGRIVDTFPGKDGHSCVAKVLCAEKTIIRPIHMLVPLNV
jgi:hypothetical protein